MRCALVLLIFCAMAGCSQRPDVSSSSDPAQSEARTETLTLVGPGGSVSIGDGVDAAKQAFPPVEDAQVFNQSMSFAILKKDGWAWGAGTGTGFEAALDRGKIVALARTDLDGPPPQDMIESESARLGNPTNVATGPLADVAVWESGDYARFLIVLKTEKYIMGPGSLAFIGTKISLKLLGYDTEDPARFVKSIEATIAAQT